MKICFIHANSRKKIIIGKDNDIVLGRGLTSIPNLDEDAKLSRQHVRFYFDTSNQCFVVKDLSSTNGTFLNHQRLDSQKAYQVQLGDIITFGNQTLEVEKIWDESKILQSSQNKTSHFSPHSKFTAPAQHTTIDQNSLNQQFSYEGSSSELFMLVIKNVFLSLITLGIYIPYAKVNLRKHIWSYTKFGEDKFYFAGTGWELLRSYLLLFGLVGAVTLTGGIFLKFNGFDFIKLLIGGSSSFGMFLYLGIAFLVLFYWACIFYMQFGTMRYLFTRTKLRNLYFNLDRTKRLEFLGSSLVGILLTFFTLGIYFPYFKANQMRFLWENSSYGNEMFKFQGTGGGYARVYFKAFMFGILFGILIKLLSLIIGTILGDSLPIEPVLLVVGYSSYFFVHAYFKAHSLNYLINNLSIQNTTLASNFNFMDILKLNMGNYFLIIITLGLALPIVFIRNMSFYVEKIEFHGTINFGSIEAASQKQGGEFAETLADVFDFEMSW